MATPITRVVGKRDTRSNRFFESRRPAGGINHQAVIDDLANRVDRVRLRLRDDLDRFPKRDRRFGCPACWDGAKPANPMPIVVGRHHDKVRGEMQARVRKVAWDPETGEAEVSFRDACRILSHHYYGRIWEEVPTGQPATSRGAIERLPGEEAREDLIQRQQEELHELRAKIDRLSAIAERVEDLEAAQELLHEAAPEPPPLPGE